MLLHDNKFSKHPGKLQMHWLGPYVINFITKGGTIQLQNSDGTMPPRLVSGSQMNPYKMGLVLCDA